MTGHLLHCPSPALWERVASAARRARVSRQFVYGNLAVSADAQPESSPAATVLDGCRKANVVCIARPPVAALQIPPATPDRRLYNRLRLYRAPVGDRSRWRSALGQFDRRAPNGLAPKPWLETTPVLEQRRSHQYQWRHRDYFASARSCIDPHPPSPAGWAPPSPAMRERGYYAKL